MDKKKWDGIKRDLPKNWAQKVSEALLVKGFEITPSQVSDIKRGKVKDPEKVRKVLMEIKKLSTKHRNRKSSLKTIL